MILLGPARLDVEKQELSIGARTVVLQRKPYLVLLYLVENRHRMVDRKELLDRFWEGKEVYDQSVSKAVGSIRKALGDYGAELIETRWGLGYRYIGPFSESLSQPSSEIPKSAATSQAIDLPSRSSGDRANDDHDPVLREGSEAASSAHVASAAARRARPRWLFSALLLACLLALVAITRIALHHNAGPVQTAQPLPVQSVAVLPFTDKGEGDGDEYLGPELADAVAVHLMTVSQLSVRPSATVRSVVGLHADPSLAGKKLAVQNLVEGEIQREKDKVVIRVRLLDTRTSNVLWSGTFNADNTNLFAAEDSIAQGVSGTLLPRLGKNTIKRSPVEETNHPEAYTAYMKGKFFATTRTRSSFAKAISSLNEAIRIDPNYAPAYASLADCYQLQGFYDFVPPSDAYPRAKAAALKALALDDSLGEAHASLLSILTDYDWDWKGAEREFKATIAIDPNYAVAYQYYGYALIGMNRGEEGLGMMKQAAQLDPVSPSVQTSLAWAYYLLRQNQNAVDQCKRVLELYPDFVPAHQLMGIVYGQIHDDQRAMFELHRAQSLERDGVITPVLVAYEFARTGRRAEAARDLGAILAKPENATVPDYYLAAAWAAAGDKRKAQAFLERALHVRSNWVIYLHYDPRFDDMRSDTQFQALLRSVDSGESPHAGFMAGEDANHQRHS